MPPSKLIPLALLFCAKLVLAQWSPEILIWENEEGTPAGPVEGYVAVDSVGHVHIVYTHYFRHPSDPPLMRTGFSYTQFDDHGNQLVPDIFISDSLDGSGGYPVLQFFGQDSLWIMWIGEGNSSSPSQKYVSMDLNGNILHPEQSFVRQHWPGGDVFLFQVRHDRTVVVADFDGIGERMYVTVQAPNGERLMDDAVVWDSSFCWTAMGYIDGTDSLQLIWQQRHFNDWFVPFTKRIDTNSPFDTEQLPVHTMLTPLGGFGPSGAIPIGDSLIAVKITVPDVPYQDYLYLYRRDTYEEINQVQLGGSTGLLQMALESDSTLSVIVGGTNNNLYFRRFGIPALELMEDSLLATHAPSGSVRARGLAVSMQGNRHVLFAKSVPGSTQLFYRYWPYVPSDVEPKDLSVANEIEISAFPNPFNSSTTFSYSLPHDSEIKLSLFDLLGRETKIIFDGHSTSGTHTITFTATDLPSGIYFAQLKSASQTQIQKIVLLK